MPSTKNRRLRKKLYLDEFAILGFELSCTLDVKTSDEFDSVLNQLIDFIESRDLLMSGGGNAELFGAFICPNSRYASATNEDRDAVAAWLDENKSTKNVTVGELVDANYGA